MSEPISPAPVTDFRPDYLPAYLSNGLIGLRVREIPLRKGLAIVNGLSGQHPAAHIESAPEAPYPLAGDICLGRVWLSDVYHLAHFCEQTYDFSSGELHSRFTLKLDGIEARVNVLTFCSRSQPTLVLQETAIEVSAPTELCLRAAIDAGEIPGRVLARHTETPGENKPVVDGSLKWEPLGGLSTCGAAYVTELLGAEDVLRSVARWDEEGPLATLYSFPARPGQTYRLRQITALVASQMNSEPDRQATRMAAFGGELGFETLRAENRAAWQHLWKGRVHLLGAERRWQALADAAFYYLNASVHSSSPAATSIFGLAQWYNYHYYYGHVMWDIEAFSVPPLLFTQPHAARAILDYRWRVMPAARTNAQLFGYRGLQFPWESSPGKGEESAPGAGTAAAYEHHISLSVALAFARYAHATGDPWFLRERAWPVLYGVAEWLTSRVIQTSRGYEIHRSMGIAERKQPIDNPAYMNMSASVVLREAAAAARRLGYSVPPEWEAIAAGLRIPTTESGNRIVSHEGYAPDEEKGATPDPLAGFFPIGYEAGEMVEHQTIRYYLDLADQYIGSPMLSACYGTWAARLGDRQLSARLFDQGYAAFVSDRFLDTHEYRDDKFPEQPWAGPFFANLGGFLMGCYYGLPGIELGAGGPETWCRRPVVMPEGWNGIEVERIWVHGRPAHLVAHHGDDRARIEFCAGD
jgi:hypothetical protein